MPRLHKYRNRDACYVLTSIRGAVVTYQLTPEGEKKLSTAGIVGGQQFHRALLLDLYRTGDAYTGGSGVEAQRLTTADQLEIDFSNDPDPETALPACDTCGSVDDLHLALTVGTEGLVGHLHCAACRATAAVRPDTSIPIGLVSRPILSRLFQMKAVARKDKNLIQFEELLRAEFESKWEALRQRRAESQTSLFDSGSGGRFELGPS